MELAYFIVWVFFTVYVTFSTYMNYVVKALTYKKEFTASPAMGWFYVFMWTLVIVGYKLQGVLFG